MDEEVKTRLEELDKRFDSLDKRFDDIKWYFGGVSAFFAVAVSLFTIVGNSNLSNERNSLQQFKTELRADLGKADIPAALELLGPVGEPLAGQELRVSFQTAEKGQPQLVIHYICRNSGGSPTGLMFVKVYATDPVVLSNTSTDEPKFRYETYVNPKDLEPADIPGAYSSEFFLDINVTPRPPRGKYPMLLKVFYGRAQVARAQFTAVVD